LRPVIAGWNSVAHAHDFDRIALQWRSGASRLEGGSQNMPGLFALGASLELLIGLGAAPNGTALPQRVLEVAQQASEALARIGCKIHRDYSSAECSGIVAFDPPGGDPAEIRRRCQQQGVALSCRSGRLRISPHAYNNQDDIERLVEAVADQ